MDLQNVLSIKFAWALVAGYHLSQFHHVFSHYGQDISFFAGNILHHANITEIVDKSNASLVDTIPQGFAVTIIASIMWASTVRYLLVVVNPSVSRHVTWKSLYFCVAAFGFVNSQWVKFTHPWMHEVATADMADPLLFIGRG
jgi:hypothetical protein